jgi:hypothetical protein
VEIQTTVSIDLGTTETTEKSDETTEKSDETTEKCAATTGKADATTLNDSCKY